MSLTGRIKDVLGITSLVETAKVNYEMGKQQGLEMKDKHYKKVYKFVKKDK